MIRYNKSSRDINTQKPAESCYNKFIWKRKVLFTALDEKLLKEQESAIIKRQIYHSKCIKINPLYWPQGRNSESMQIGKGTRLIVVFVYTDNKATFSRFSNACSYHLQFPAIRCPPGWRSCQVRRDPGTRAPWTGPHQTCWQLQSVYAPSAARRVTRCQNSPLRRGGVEVEVQGWRPETPSVEEKQ